MKTIHMPVAGSRRNLGENRLCGLIPRRMLSFFSSKTSAECFSSVTRSPNPQQLGFSSRVSMRLVIWIKVASTAALTPPSSLAESLSSERFSALTRKEPTELKAVNKVPIC